MKGKTSPISITFREPDIRDYNLVLKHSELAGLLSWIKTLKCRGSKTRQGIHDP